MVKLVWNKRFKRNLEKYTKKHPELSRLIEEKMRLFVEDPYHVSLRNHKLTGKLNGFRAIVIEFDCRLIFEPLEGNEVLLVDIGGHDDVY